MNYYKQYNNNLNIIEYVLLYVLYHSSNIRNNYNIINFNDINFPFITQQPDFISLVPNTTFLI